MTKIVMIGAGSAGFCRILVQDILAVGGLDDAHIALTDVDAGRLDTTFQVMNRMKEQNGLACTFSASTDRRECLKDAGFAISMIQVGGLEPYETDMSIPLKYGVDQCVGDTVGPGGVFRGLRHVPALLGMLKDMEELCPDIIFMNYANPMAICSWAMQKVYPNVTSVGLCHGVQHTTNMLCKWLDVPVDEVDVVTAGINHMAWFLKFAHQGVDLYPALWNCLRDDGPIEGEEYRFEMMKAAGYFMTESPGHLSEYLPYFRKRNDIQDLFGGAGFSGETGAYLRMCKEGLEHYSRDMADYASGKVPVPFQREISIEYAADIIKARLTGTPFRFAGNVLNKGYITNLPYDSCVEVPVFVDRDGLHGSFVGAIPPQCAALNQSNISMQELAVKAAIEGDREAAFYSIMLDPLTAAVLAPHEIRNMVDELFEAQSQWLPQFAGKHNSSPGATIGRLPNGEACRQKTSTMDRVIGHYDKKSED